MPSNSITKPCHNCRRRRLRCDRSWPSCHKCALSGQECLGYGKVFVWTQAIDSYGVPPPPPGSGASLDESGRFQPQALAVEVGPSVLRGPQERYATAAWVGAESDGQVQNVNPQNLLEALPSSPVKRPDPSELGHPQTLVFRKANFGDDATSSVKTDASPADDGDNSSLDLVEIKQDRSRLSTQGNLTDPIFQDLDGRSRYYLAHFANEVCKDLVARDSLDSNPFRQLIPLTNQHPLLLQILIATSAIHWSNSYQPRSADPSELTDPGGYLAQLRSQHLVSRQALIDALTAKQKAINHLQGVLHSLDPAGTEIALTAMHFFVKFDLIDLDRSSGKGWQAHLEGASSILARLAPDSAGDTSSRMLRDCVIADCVIYHIMGSILATGAIASRISCYALELLPVMKRVEVNSYLSCPSEILHIILLTSKLSYEIPRTNWTRPVACQARALIDRALDFDICAWADQLRERPNVPDIESRIHIASAHRSAVCLYILQALPLVRDARTVDTNVVVEDILSHLGEIHEQDPYFKATSWPTFMAGAETRDAEKRAWALSRMFTIWKICPWGYILTAIEMLKATWQMQDSGTSSVVNWLRELKDLGFDYLIV